MCSFSREKAGNCRDMNIDHILTLSVVGGLLDGTRIAFDTGLNCIIGARGTGKTTLLEFVRWVLDELPRKDIAPVARKRVESLIEGNLQGGRVELEIQTRDGLRYFVTRAAGEAPIVLDASRNPTALSVGGSFFRADVFSQNEVETIADHGKFQLELIDSFAREEVAGADRTADDVCHQIMAHARLFEPLLARQAALAEEIKQLPMVEEKLKAFVAQGDQSADAVNKAHALKALRDRENRLFDGARGFLGGLNDELGTFKGRFKAEFTGKFTQEMLDGPNHEVLQELRELLTTCSKAVDAAIKTAWVAVAECLDDIHGKEESLRLVHQQQELAFRELIEKHKQHQSQSVERAALEKKRNTIIECRNESTEIDKQIKAAEKRRIALLGSLSEARDHRFSIRKQVADRLNAALAPNITVSIQQDGNTDAYQSLVESSMKGSGVKQGMLAQKLIRTLPPGQLADLVRSADPTALMERSDLSPDQAGKVMAVFNNPEKLAELETVGLQDAPSIRLRVGDQEKDSTTLSTGQKCTTILPILLLEGGRPLLVDQPEDNLDNRFIFETVVANIHKVKTTRQLIFVTHNPNIPVLGDAACVFVMESDGEHALAATTGSVDECRTQIVTLLEGGAEAFRQRGQRYGVKA
jgi:ABC-type lipoprotein export system ATPase subunit